MYLICIHFGIVCFMLFCFISGWWLLLSGDDEERNDSFNYYFQNQPHRDRLKAEMNRTVAHTAFARRIKCIISRVI